MRKIIGICIATLLLIPALSGLGTITGQNAIMDDEEVFFEEKTSINPETSELLHETVTIRHHLLPRQFVLYVPSSYDGSNPVPLVLMFHGGQNTPENASMRYGVSEKAEEEGFIVVYPNASEMMGDSWNFGLGWYTASWFDELGRWLVDEKGYVMKIIDKMQNDYNIDTNRIYAAGHSNGGMMAYYIASVFSDTFAAIASNSGCIGGHLQDFEMVTIPEPENPVAIIAFHGKKDTVVPYDGGWDRSHSVYYTSVGEAVSFWIEHDGCDSEAATDVHGNVTIDCYSNGDAGTEVIIYSIENKGHIWFGGQPWEDPNPEISTTDEMWEFFETHPKQ